MKCEACQTFYRFFESVINSIMISFLGSYHIQNLNIQASLCS